MIHSRPIGDITMNHDNDRAQVAQLLAEFDAVEQSERQADLAADPRDVEAGRAFVAAAAEYLLYRCRSADMTRETCAALRTAIRVRVNALPPSDQIRALESEMTGRFQFTGAELDRLKILMQPGERLVELKPRAVITDRREIPRSNL